MISHNSSNTVVLSREEATPRGTLEQYIALERTFRPPARRNTDGSINWRCPCVRSSVGAPCGAPFRSFIDCLDRLLASLPMPPASPQASSTNPPSSVTTPPSAASASASSEPALPMPSFCTEERARVFDCMHRHDRYYKSLLEDLQRDDDDPQMPSK